MDGTDAPGLRIDFALTLPRIDGIGWSASLARGAMVARLGPRRQKTQTAPGSSWRSTRPSSRTLPGPSACPAVEKLTVASRGPSVPEPRRWSPWRRPRTRRPTLAPASMRSPWPPTQLLPVNGRDTAPSRSGGSGHGGHRHHRGRSSAELPPGMRTGRRALKARLPRGSTFGSPLTDRPERRWCIGVIFARAGRCCRRS